MTRKDALAKLGKKLAESWSDICTCGCTSFEDAYGAGFAAAVDLLLPCIETEVRLIERWHGVGSDRTHSAHMLNDQIADLDAKLKREE